jgi:uncharacterized RDD family membrane protein YckC
VSCPACGIPLVAGQERCGGCGALLSPLIEGNLAPEPAPLRELPGARRRDKSWKDEVRDRVRNRKEDRSREPEPLVVREEIPAPEPPLESKRSVPQDPAAPAVDEVGPRGVDPYALTARFPEVDPEAGDLPLHPLAAPPPEEAAGFGAELEPEPVPSVSRSEVEREPWSFEPLPLEGADSDVERPAFVAERLRAAAVDLLFLGALWGVVVYFAYFAGRSPHAGASQLLRTWPWLVGYLAFLGLTYAAYFTGTTGQTLGKIVGSLRVVDKAGRPPGYPRSFLRAGLGALGALSAGLGVVPMLLDPARRGFHDKLLGTRVIRQ